jgi:molybdenum cofactor cytidylyltransferase
MTLSCLRPAAGASSRMRGGDKLLEPVGERSCLAEMAARVIRAGLRGVVTLPSLDHPRAKALEGLDVEKLVVPDWARGMSESLKAGAAALPPDARGLMVLPPDMPDILSADLAALAEAYAKDSDCIFQAQTRGGVPGHPVVFPADLLKDFRALSGDNGARPILRAYATRVRYLRFSNDGPVTDLDTPEAWEAWRAAG